MSEIAESFASSLSELTYNSKPHINMLTMLADDHLEHAPIITQTVLTHLQKAPTEIKLPMLYLIDSIVKNVGKAYINLFTQNIVQCFTTTFEKVDEKTREQMFKLRQTWGDLFPQKVIYALDAKVHQIDPAWPLSAPPSTVHLNPKFFKPDLLDSKLSTTKDPEMNKCESRSHRKSKTFRTQNHNVSKSSRSKKPSPPTASVEAPAAVPAKPAAPPNQLREQMLMKQKMLLELKQQKLKLELMQTQAQLEEQQKQLERHSVSSKTSQELSKLQQLLKQGEDKIKMMDKNIKKQSLSNRQQIVRVTNDMKANKITDLSKVSSGMPETLMKPAALLELNQEDKPKPAAKSRSRVVIPPMPAVDKQKVVTSADSTEDAVPPVRIAPVSSQLINAALSFGRNVRDPRIRQMSNRLSESQLGAAAPITPPTPMQPPPAPAPVSTLAPALPQVPAPPRKVDVDPKPYDKNRKDRKSSNQRERERSSKYDEESRHHSRSSSRTEKSSSRSRDRDKEKTSPKRSEEKISSSRRARIEELFSDSRSKSPVDTKHSSNSTNSHSQSSANRDQNSKVDNAEALPKPTHGAKTESSPKRSKEQEKSNTVDNLSHSEPSKGTQKSLLDVTKAHSTKPPEIPLVTFSPEPMDSSAEMKDEDIENIVRHGFYKPQQFETKQNESIKEKTEGQELSRLGDAVEDIDDIIRHPNKHIKVDRRTMEDKTNTKDDNKSVKEAFQSKEDTLDPDTLPSLKSNFKQDIRMENQLQPKTSETLIIRDTKSSTDAKILEEELNRESELLSESTENEVSSSMDLNSFSEYQNNIHESFFQEEVVSTEVETEEYVPMDFETLPTLKEAETILKPFQTISESKSNVAEFADAVSTLKTSELMQSPKKILSPKRGVEQMETIVEDKEMEPLVGFSSPKKSEKRQSTPPVQQEKRPRKGDKLSLMEQAIADAERHEASPSPPPPPVISDKFKEIKQSSLSRLRRVGRSREDLMGQESPEPADVDLRPQIAPLATLNKDLKNEVLGLAEKDVDLRGLPGSPTKKRPSMEKLIDIPPAKKSKAEVMDEWTRQVAPVCKIRYFPARPDPAHWYNNSRICIYKRLFGSEDVDLRPVLCPPPPSPPPPPVISSPPPDSAGERLWARYKQNKPDAYKVKYTPSRRDKTPSIDKFGRYNRLNSSDGRWGGRPKNAEDVDMRAPPLTPDCSYNHIIIQAMEQHKRGDLDNDAYKRVLSEVFAMREKQQLEEAQRRDEEAQAELEPISDDEISAGSLSGVEDAPSPPESYSGGEDIDESCLKKSKTEEKSKADETQSKSSDNFKDIDIRLPPIDVDIRPKTHSHYDKDDKSSNEKSSRRSRRPSPPYSRRSEESEKDKIRRQRNENRASRRERKAKKLQEERERYKESSRYGQEAWMPPSEVQGGEEPEDAPRVPPLPPYVPQPHDGLAQPMVRPPHWDQRMPGPPAGPWMSGMPPTLRGPPVMGLRPPQDRFMPPRWHQPGPGPIFEGDAGPGSRYNRFGPPPMGRFPLPHMLPEIPPTDQSVLKAIEEDTTRSINIDAQPRDIRFYGIKAVAFMSWDDPREICFQPGSRRVIIDERDSVVVQFNGPPVEMFIDGKPRRIRFGAPTRELFIENQWYEIFFGGPPVPCIIGGKSHMVQLEGPPPPVKPGVSRKDLVRGKISLIVDAKYHTTIYLDAKPQKFQVDKVWYIIRFVEALQKTLINGVPFNSDFGGLPRPIILNGVKHFFRLTEIPKDVVPGYVSIANMEGGRLPSPPGLVAPPQLPASLEQAMLIPPLHMTAPPRISPEIRERNRDMEPAKLLPTPASASSTPLVSTQPPNSTPAPVVAAPMNPLDMLSTLLPSAEQGRTLASYSLDSETSNPAPDTSSSATTATGEINVTELLQKLMATGIVPSLEPPKDKASDKPFTTDSSLIKPVDFRKPETLKTRQTTLISHLYSGIQCNSCGVRFPPEQTMKYSQHLDWHFRQNRRDKDSSRTAQTRRYYYDVSDWVQFEEIEDLEERAQPWFEMQDGIGEEEEPVRALVSVRAADYPDEAACLICHDKFESFYNEEKEEWHLRNAADHEGKLVHPICLEDQKAAAEKPIVVDDIDITEDEPKEEEPKKDEEVVEEKKEEPPKEEEDDDIMEVMDIEYIKPVFPVEDLTVSDNEEGEEKEDQKKEEEEGEAKEENKLEEGIIEEVTSTTNETEEISQDGKSDAQDDAEPKEEEEKEEERSAPEASQVVEEDSQDDLVMMEKGDDSMPSDAEIKEVIKKMKKDPDALGGEYEDTDNCKKEKGEIPLPAPVVDTTHATVTCLIDGNVEFEEPAPKVPSGPPRIKINISKAIQPAAKEKEVPEEETTDLPPGTEINLDKPKALPLMQAQQLLNAQPLPPGEEPYPQSVKDRIKSKKMVELPVVSRDNEISGLCSIM